MIPRWLVLTVIIVGVANFVLFGAVAIWLGGDAINGHSGAGHYFVCGAGRCYEVGRATFRYSQWHTVSVFLTWPLVMAGAWWLSRN